MSRNWYYENAIIKIEKLPIKVYSGQIRRAFLHWIKINWSKSVLRNFQTSIKVIFQSNSFLILKKMKVIPTGNYIILWNTDSEIRVSSRVSVQGVKSLGGHFAWLCRGFEFYEVKKKKKLLLFFKKKMEILLHFLSFF